MAIKSNKKIDFEYEFESNDNPYSIVLRFHNSEEYGPTITVLSDDGEPAISFPAGMFSEVSDFLIEQGIIEGKRTVVAPAVPQKLPKATGQLPARSSLPRPTIAVAKPKINPLRIGNKQISNPIELNIDDDDSGVEFEDAPEDMKDLLKQEQERIQDIQENIEGAVPAQTLSNSAKQLQFTEEEAQSIIAERQKALLKTKPAERVIRKK